MFGDLLASCGLAAMLRQTWVTLGRANNFAIRIGDRAAIPRWDSIMESVRAIRREDIVTPVDPKALSQLKFSGCLPRELATKELESRLTDRPGIVKILGERWVEMHGR